MPHFKLVSFKLCPFVQRSIITLLEKGVDYDIEYIDLAAKPDWFLAISPFGKVPVLIIDDDVVLFESAVINEYLDETAPGRRLHPADPLRRAHNRAWIEFGSSLLFDQYQMALAPNEEQARRAVKAQRDKLARIEEQLGEGPYFNGADFSLVDAAVAPMLARARWLADITPEVDVTKDLPKVAAWQQALLDRPSVQGSTVDDIVERLVTSLKKPQASNGDRPGWIGSMVA